MKQGKSLANHLKLNKALFAHSFKTIDRNLLYAIFADMLQVVFILVILIPGMLFLLKGSMMPLITNVMPTLVFVNSYSQAKGELPPTTPEMQEMLETSVSGIKSFFIKSALVIAGFLALLIFASSMFRGFVYSRLHKVKFKKFIRRFALHNFLWFIFWALLIVAAFLLFKAVAAGFVIALFIMLIILFTPIYRSLHSEGDTVKKQITRFFSKGIFRFYRLFISLFLIFIVAIISSLLLSLLFGVLPSTLFLFIFFIYAFMLVSWARHYIFISVGSHLKKEGN